MLRASSQTFRFVFVLYVIWMFLVLDVVCLIVYNRQTLLEIGSTVTHRKPDFKFLNTTTRCLQTTLKGLLFGPLDRDAENDHQLPSILLANVQSLDNKLCELRDCSIICLTETCMSREVPDFAMEPMGFSVHRADRIPDLSGKSKGGGVCFTINNSWCDRKNAHPI